MSSPETYLVDGERSRPTNVAPCWEHYPYLTAK